MWEVGLEARGVALGLLGIACVFVILCVSIGAGVHKNYETPTPVCNLPLSFAILYSLLTPLVSVLVLDQPSVPG